MEKMRALIANEPRTYREVLVDALRWLRPQAEVSTVEPDDLDAEIGRLRPHLVVCSRVLAAAPAGPLIWVTLYPKGENRAEIFTAGERITMTNIRFSDLLLIFDHAEVLCRSA
jgi:hypothetical protein